MAKRTSSKRRSTRRRAPAKRSASSVNFRTAMGRLRRLKPHHQCQAMKLANNDFIKQMCTHIRKLRHKRGLNHKQVDGLRRHAPKLRTLANTKVSLKKKRNLLSQRGGFLPMIAPLLMSVAAPVIKGLASAFR